MFTGIIEEVGAVTRRAGDQVTILGKVILDDLKLGDSVAIDGVCLTVASLHGDQFVVRVSPETFERSTLSGLKPGSAVNLERAMRAGDRFGGHMVQGHVDGVGRVKSIHPQGQFAVWRFQAPPEVTRYLVPKGSVAVDGISLTVVEPEGDTFGVALIPTTLELTTLRAKRAGSAVNLEADVFGKHVFHYLKGMSTGSLTLDSLSRHGFV